MMSEEQKKDELLSNDFSARFLRALQKTLVIFAMFIVTIFGTMAIKQLFPVPIIFIIVYVCLLFIVIAFAGAIDSYILSNILTGFAVAFGMLIINPKNLISLNF